MSAQLSSTALLALRPTAEAPVRLATEGLSSPGAVAGQFAALLATMRDGSAEAGAASQNGAPSAGGLSNPGQNAAAGGEHRVASAAVSLLMQDLNDTPTASADEALTPSARRRLAPADVSNQVVEGTVNRGAPISAPWMATLMAAGMTAAQ